MWGWSGWLREKKHIPPDFLVFFFSAANSGPSWWRQGDWCEADLRLLYLSWSSFFLLKSRKFFRWHRRFSREKSQNKWKFCFFFGVGENGSICSDIFPDDDEKTSRFEILWRFLHNERQHKKLKCEAEEKTMSRRWRKAMRFLFFLLFSRKSSRGSKFMKEKLEKFQVDFLFHFEEQ